MPKGIIKFYLEQKGYGYLRDLESRAEFHFSKRNLKTIIKDKDFVHFEIAENKQGLYADKIEKIGESTDPDENIMH